MTGRKGMDSAAFGAVGMCITGHLMELWETLFAGCGKVLFTFPWAVNGVFHGGMAGYAHFHCAIFFVFQRSRSSAHSIGQRPIRSVPGERAASSGTELFGGLGASPNKRFCGAKRQSVYHSALLASFVLWLFGFPESM